jgi:hypothetical protein
MMTQRLVVSLLVALALSFCPLFCDPQKQSTRTSSDHCQKPMKDNGKTKISCCRSNFADIKNTTPDTNLIFLSLAENGPRVAEVLFSGSQPPAQIEPAFESATHSILRV